MMAKPALFSVTYLEHGSSLWRTTVVRGWAALAAVERRLRRRGLRRSNVANRRYGVFNSGRVT